MAATWAPPCGTFLTFEHVSWLLAVCLLCCLSLLLITTVEYLCSWLPATDRTCTNIGMHCQCRRVFGSKNLWTVSNRSTWQKPVSHTNAYFYWDTDALWKHEVRLVNDESRRRRPTAEDRFSVQCQICGAQSDTGTGFSPGTAFFLCQFHSTDGPNSFCHLRTTPNSFNYCQHR